MVVTTLLALTLAAQPRELGKVPFKRDFEAAKADARATGKPLLVLFDEVPGCSNCTSFGDAVLSDELIVAAASEAFVPVAIFNNEGGDDGRVLKHFGEPAWNNPVVRIMTADEVELAPRLHDTYAKEAVARQMVTALRTGKREVPGYLDALASRGASFTQAYLVMGCFWAGEACIGALDGVASTRVGYLQHNEVVEVQPAFGADIVSVIADALKNGCASDVYVRDEGLKARLANANVAATLTKESFSYSAKDDKYQIRKLKDLALTPEQATRVNAAVARGAPVATWLTPQQRKRAKSE